MQSRAVRQALVVLGVAIAGLVSVWRLLPAASPPIYDGICIADPYRSLGGSPAPSSASKEYAAGPQSPTDELITNETPAQAQILMMQGTFSSPSAGFTLSVTPVQPPKGPPSGYTLDGNTYRIVATDAAGKMLQPSAQAPVTVVLRGTSMKGSSLTMYVDSGSGWTPLKTFNAGCGFTFEAVSTQLGYFGLFSQQAADNSSSTGNSGNSGGGAPIAVIVAVVIVVVIVGVIVVVRITSRPRAAPARRSGRKR